MPAGIKLCPLRRKFQFRDQREHRKRDLYITFADENWDNVFGSSDVDEAVFELEKIIHGHLDRCIKTVTMSSRDPVWMTPLVKSMLRVKSQINGNVERLKAVNKRISTFINQNRMSSLENISTREWWRTVI